MREEGMREVSGGLILGDLASRFEMAALRRLLGFTLGGNHSQFKDSVHMTLIREQNLFAFY
jgi:hypothetical protein